MDRGVIFALQESGLLVDFESANGKIANYEVSAFQEIGSSRLLVAFSTYLAESEKILACDRISKLQIKSMTVEPFEFGIMISISTVYFAHFNKRLLECTDAVIKVLKEMQAPDSDYCPLTGKKLELLTYKQINLPYCGFRIKIDGDAEIIANNIIAKREAAIKNKPNRYLFGTVGILIGAIVGIAIAFLFSLASYVTVLSGFGALLGLFLYKRFNAKEGATMILLSSIVSTILIMGGVIFSYIFMCGQAAIQAGKDYNMFDAFLIVINNPGSPRRIFIFAMIVNFVEILVSEISFILIIRQRKNKIKKVNKVF